MNRSLRVGLLSVAAAGWLQALAADPTSEPRRAEVVVPPNALYVCVVDAGGDRTQTVIELDSRLAQLCAAHPEMGPCQYERNACRRGGGRVYAAGGKEITKATEAEYDKKVLRVPLKGG